MKPNEKISQQRREMQLSAIDVADRGGVGREAYRDIEAYEDEAYTTVPLANLRSIASILGLNLLSLFELPSAFCSNSQSGSIKILPRNLIVQEREKALGIGRSQLSDLIGFEEQTIARMESEPDFLEEWSVDLIVQLAKILQVSPHLLIVAPCEHCGQG